MTLSNETLSNEFKLDRDDKKMIIRAEKYKPNEMHHFDLKKGISKGFSEFNFSQNNDVYLKLKATMSIPDEALILTVEEKDRRFELNFDFSKYEANHNVFISGIIDGRAVNGTFEALTNNYRGDDISLDKWFSNETRKRLDDFSPVLNEVKSNLDNQRKPYEKTIHSRSWGEAGPIVCWGLASLGAAAITAFSAGAGGSLAAAAFTAAGQYCASQYQGL